MVTQIKMARVKTGLQQKAFAEKHGLPRTRLSRIESAREYVPPAWRAKLADALGLEVEDLCDENGWPRLVQTTEAKQ